MEQQMEGTLMFGALSKAVAALSLESAPTFAPVWPYGRAPRKIKVSGPPAVYPDTEAGQVAKDRAIRRFNRWIAANPGKQPPTHIWHNMATATNAGA